MENNMTPPAMPAQHRKGGMIAVSVGLLIVGLLAGYALGYAKQEDSGWETYRNETYGFEFQHPSSLENNLYVEVLDGPMNDDVIVDMIYSKEAASKLESITIGGKKAYFYVVGDAGAEQRVWLIPLSASHHIELSLSGDWTGDEHLEENVFSYAPKILDTFKFTN